MRVIVKLKPDGEICIKGLTINELHRITGRGGVMLEEDSRIENSTGKETLLLSQKGIVLCKLLKRLVENNKVTFVVSEEVINGL